MGVGVGKTRRRMDATMGGDGIHGPTTSPVSSDQRVPYWGHCTVRACGGGGERSPGGGTPCGGEVGNSGEGSGGGTHVSDWVACHVFRAEEVKASANLPARPPMLKGVGGGAWRYDAVS